MNHPAFQTDLDELGALAAVLSRAEQALQDALDSLHDTTAASIGTSGLDRACEDFQQHWRYGLQQLRRQTADTADGVRATAGHYRDTELALVAAFTPVPVPGAAR